MVEVTKLPMWETWIEFQTDMTPVTAEYLKVNHWMRMLSHVNSLCISYKLIAFLKKQLYGTPYKIQLYMVNVQLIFFICRIVQSSLQKCLTQFLSLQKRIPMSIAK